MRLLLFPLWCRDVSMFAIRLSGLMGPALLWTPDSRADNRRGRLCGQCQLAFNGSTKERTHQGHYGANRVVRGCGSYIFMHDPNLQVFVVMPQKLKKKTIPQDTSNESLEKLIKEHSAMFDLCGPMRSCAPSDARNLFMEGDLKFKDNLGKVCIYIYN